MPDVLSLGTDEGFSEPSVTGQSNPFPYENLHAVTYRRLAENRLAGLANKTLDYALNQNDVVAAHRAVYSNRQAARHPRLLVAASLGSGQGYANANVPILARASTGTLTDGTGKALASPGDVTRLKGLAIGAIAGLFTFPPGAGRGNDVFVQWLTAGDTDLAGTVTYLVRTTDANNWIGIARQAATNLRVQRNVAGTPATERDITILSTTPTTGNALGIRLSGTSAQVFLN